MTQNPRHAFYRKGAVFIRQIGRHDIWMHPERAAAWVVWADDHDYCAGSYALEPETLTDEEFEIFRALFVLCCGTQPAELKKKKSP